MSSPERPAGKAREKPVAKKAPAKSSSRTAGSKEPTGAQKAAILKAMYKGLEPGSKAATKSAAKKKTALAPKVEVLRKISAAPQAPENQASRAARELAASIEKAIADGTLDHLQPHAVQALTAALCKLYAANHDAGHRYPIVAGRMAVTGTDVMIACGALLKAADLQVFELGMWQSWAGR